MATDKDREWSDKIDQIINVEASELARKAHEDALEYLQDVIENMGDKQWRKMGVDSQAIEIGVGIQLHERIVPAIVGDMKKNMHKRLKLSKEVCQVLTNIYMGRVVKNLVKAINERDK
jgi:hypothetical protein